ncbi:metalloregulator ArsR/SmtB family transcription factor [Salinispira pacifica]
MNSYLDQLKAVAEPARFRLVRLLSNAQDELCICELVDVLQLPQYAVSRAARTLLAAGILAERRDGKLSYYRITGDPFVDRLAALVRSVPEDEDPFPYDLDRLRWRLDIREAGRCIVTYRKPEQPQEAGVEGAGKPSILFICVHNSARSQIAEEYLRRYGGDLFEVESAGLTPGELNPYVVETLAEEGIDISDKRPRSVFDLYRAGRTYAYVITVCSREAEENCPVFPGPVMRLNWPFPDPSRFTGSHGEIAARVRELRDVIREEIIQFTDAYRRKHTVGAET